MHRDVFAQPQGMIMARLRKATNPSFRTLSADALTSGAHSFTYDFPINAVKDRTTYNDLVWFRLRLSRVEMRGEDS